MPLYEYQCKAGHITERERPMVERNGSVRCACGKWADRVVSATPGIVRNPAVPRRPRG